MYCTECGKQNPDGARFCAFCGEKIAPASENITQIPETPTIEDTPPWEDSLSPEELSAPEPPTTEPAQDTPPPVEEKNQEPPAEQPDETPSPAPRKVQPAAPKSVRRRPVDPSRTVVPVVENPAQPIRPGETRAAPTWRPDQPVELDPPPRRARREPIEPEQSPEPAPEEKPRRKVSHRAPTTAVTASGEEEALPARRAPVKKNYQRVGDVPNTIVPDRVRQKKIDLFFDGGDDEDYDEEYEDYDDDDDGKLRRRILSIVASILVLAAFSLVFWLLATSSGQVFRASMGLSAPARAYKLYGDQLREKGNVRESAAAYYDALKLEPDNFQYAILTGQTQEIIGENETAEKAYLQAITVDGAKAEAYRLLALLYERQGKTDKQRQTLEAGYAQTQSIELKEMLDQME